MNTTVQAPQPSTSMQVYSSRADDNKVQFETDNREAMALAESTWTPKHLIGKNPRETQATCLGLVTMARKWNMAASMVAGETYSVHGKIGFQGKLYAALANAHGGLFSGLRVIYAGKGDNLAAVIFGSASELSDADRENLKKFVKTEDADAATDLELNGVKAIRVTVAQCKTDQSMWQKDPQQKLFYSGATKWCRRFMPDLVLGAVSVEDLERIDYVERHPETNGASRTAALENRLACALDATYTPDTAQASSPQDA